MTNTTRYVVREIAATPNTHGRWIVWDTKLNTEYRNSDYNWTHSRPTAQSLADTLNEIWEGDHE